MSKKRNGVVVVKLFFFFFKTQHTHTHNEKNEKKTRVQKTDDDDDDEGQTCFDAQSRDSCHRHHQAHRGVEEKARFRTHAPRRRLR